MRRLQKIKSTGIVHSALCALIVFVAQPSSVEAMGPLQKKLEESGVQTTRSSDSLDGDTLSCEQYRLAQFEPDEGWNHQYKKLPASIKSLDFEYDQDYGLKLTYNLRASPSKRLTPVRIRSNKISSTYFVRIDAVILRLTGNRAIDRLFVTVIDSSGEYFVPKTRIYLTFGQPMEAELSFAPNNVSHHGGNNDGVMDPPLKVDTLNILSDPAADTGRPVILHDMTIRGMVAINPEVDGNCREFTTTDPSEGEFGEKRRFISIDPEVFRLPFEVNETRYIDYYAEKLHRDIKVIKAALTMCHVLSGDVCTRVEKTVTKNHAGHFLLPVHAVSKGYYTVSIELFDGSRKLPVQVAGEVLVWDPFRHRNDKPLDHFFGMMSSLDLHPKYLDTDLKLMRDAGVGIVRFLFRWPTVEKERHRYQWKQYDRIFSSLDKYGLLAQPMIIQTPKWARKKLTAPARPVKPYYEVFTVPESLTDFSDFVYKSAKRYSRYNNYWEIWNEPMAPHYWVGGTKEDYVQLLKAGYRAVKKGSPNAQVLVAGLGVFTPKQIDYVKYILEHGSSDFDVFAYHTHGPSERLDASLAESSGLLAGTDREFEVWINETGIPIAPDRPDGELVRASEFVKKMVLSRANNIQNLTWFIFRQNRKALESPKDNYAVIGVDNKPRPVLVAYNNIVHLLSGSSAVSPVLKSDASYSYSFKRSNELTHVLWNNPLQRDKNITVELASPMEEYMLIDMFGGKVPYERINNTLNIMSNSVYPVFLVRRFR